LPREGALLRFLFGEKREKEPKKIAACIRPAMLPNAMQYTRSKVPAKMSRKRKKPSVTELAVEA
jgi:hypothetical protein